MTTIELDDLLINRVIEIGHYQNAQKAINTILSDYIHTHQGQNTPFDKLYLELDMDGAGTCRKYPYKNTRYDSMCSVIKFTRVLVNM